MNKCILIGRWVKDLELSFISGTGTAVAKGTLAVDRRFKKDGEKQTDFIPVVIWGKQAESAANYTGKGKLTGVSGSINTRSYDAKDGSGKRYVTEVIAEEVQFLEWGSSGNAASESNATNELGNEEGITPVEDGDSIPF